MPTISCPSSIPSHSPSLDCLSHIDSTSCRHHGCAWHAEECTDHCYTRFGRLQDKPAVEESHTEENRSDCEKRCILHADCMMFIFTIGDGLCEIYTESSADTTTYSSDSFVGTCNIFGNCSSEKHMILYTVR